MSKICKICNADSNELTTIYTTINGKILECSGLMHMVELYINKNISDNIVSPPPLICNFCIHKISEEFVVNYKQKQQKINNKNNKSPIQAVVSSTVLPSDNNELIKKKTIISNNEDYELTDEDLFIDEFESNTPEANKKINQIVENKNEREIIKVKEKTPQSKVTPNSDKKQLKKNKTKTESIAKHFIKYDKPESNLISNKNTENIKKLKDDNSVENNNDTIDNEIIECENEQSPLSAKNKEHKINENVEISSSSSEEKISKDNSIDYSNVKNEKSKEEKTKNCKSKNYKSQDIDKSKEEKSKSYKSKEEKSKNYKSKDNNKSKEEKTKNYKSKDDDKSKEEKYKDNKQSPSSSKKRDLKRQRSEENTKKSSSDEDKDLKLKNNEETSSSGGRRHLKRLCQRNAKEIEQSVHNNEQDYTKKLNIECLSKIFSNLSILEIYKIENVCPRWKEASTLSWKYIKVLDSNKLIVRRDDKSFSCKEDAIKKLLVKCGNYLNEITLSHLSGPLMIQIISNYCQNLLHLKLHNIFVIRGSTMEKNLPKIEKLETIRLEGFTVADKDPSITYNQILFGLQKNIKEIHLIPDLNYSVTLSDEFTMKLEKFDNLQCLTLRSCKIDANVIKAIIEKKNIIYLDLGHCELLESISSISTLNNLEHFDINQVKNIDNDSINNIINNCRKLKHLNLVGCINILPLTIMNISKLYDLEYLNLENLLNVDTQSIINISNNCLKLNYLNLKSCKNISDNAICELSKLQKLEYLNMNFLFNVNTQSLSEITNKCRKLKSLNIGFCSNVSESGLKDISKLSYIEHLDLGRVKNITDNVINRITKKCFRLKYLNINECSKRVSSTALNDIKYLKNLEELIIDNVANATDEMFLKVYKLRILSCVGCTNISDITVKNILKNCSDIENLNISKTSVTVDSLNRAAKEMTYRKHNIPLKIQINSSVNKDFDKTKYNTNLLTVLPIN